MKILVDADACPVKEIIVRLAKQRNIPATMLIDTSHQLNDGYSTVITVDKQADSMHPQEGGTCVLKLCNASMRNFSAAFRKAKSAEWTSH